MNAEIHILREMIRADLELAFDHLNNDEPALARHELQNALTKLSQIEDLMSATRRTPTQQPLLLPDEPTDTTRPNPGTDPAIDV